MATVYDWLDGVDTIEMPPPVTFRLQGFQEIRADTEAEVAFTARPVDGGTAGGTAEMSIRYRISLLERNSTPVANRTLQQQPPGNDDWSQVATDEQGQALLGSAEGVSVADLVPDEGATTRLRMVLPAGRYAFVVEAVDAAAPGNPTVVGVGTAVIKLE